jgi:pyridoxal phosphate enzyme (YggS family)
LTRWKGGSSPDCSQTEPLADKNPWRLSARLNSRDDRFMIEERIRANLDAIERRMTLAADRAGRRADSVRLVAVTKQSPPEWIRPLVECGAHDLGENYPQELWRKCEALADLRDKVRWHLIGHLQSNKVKKTIALVQMIHSVDSLKLLHALDQTAAAMGPPPCVCLQVNTSGESTKHGWTAEQILSDAEAIAACRAIPVVGLMTMTALDSTAETARGCFSRLRELRDTLRARTGLPLTALSMGMSSDFESAIMEGATLVRVGSALFQGIEP